MRKSLAVLLDLAGGLALVAAAFVAVRTLLQSRSLVYLFLPLLAAAALGLGAWRGRSRTLPAGITVVLLNLPLALLVVYAAGRTRALWALPVVGLASATVGVAAARGLAAWRGRRDTVAPPATAHAVVTSAGRSVPAAPAVPATLAALATVAVLGALGAMGPRFARSLVVIHEVREPAVPFQLALTAGAPVTAEELRGRVAVIDFWATWCIPCQHELPELERLSRRFAGNPRVVFYAVDVPMGDTPDVAGDTPQQAVAFFRRHGFGMPLAFDAGGRAAGALRAHGLPTLLVLDRAGRVRLRHVGYAGAEDLSETLTRTIEDLLAEPAA